MSQKSQDGSTAAIGDAPRVFVCDGCAQVLSFGASECDGCGALYRYRAGRAIRTDERDGEPAASSVSPAIAFQAEEVGERARRMRAPSVVPVGALIVVMALDLTTETVLAVTPALPAELNVFPFVAFGLLLWWMRSTNATLRTLGTEGLRYSPNGTVLFWFVPLANLISPYRAMKELWLASNPKKLDGWQRARATLLLPSWWAAYLAQLISGNLSVNDPNIGQFALLSGAVCMGLSTWLYLDVHLRLTQRVERLARW
jgi:hypothetical protein